MIIICSTDKKDDVLKGIRQARKTGTSITPMQGIAILQVAKALYKKLENDREKVSTILEKRVANYKVNAKTLMLHRSSCKCPTKNKFMASIVNPAKTGLKLCKRCMSNPRPVFISTSGYKYLHSGDESGDLCKVCGNSMRIDKHGKKWTLICSCGREIPFINNSSNYDGGNESIFK